MFSIKNKLSLFFSLLSIITYAQDFEGSSYDPTTSESSAVFYSVTSSGTEWFYFSKFKIYDKSKKKLLSEITTANDKKKNKLSCTVIALITETKTVSYDPANSGLFYSNNSLQDATVEKTSLANPSYEYIFSFKDTGRTIPFLHKITLPDGVILSLDEITDTRLARHKNLIAALSVTQQTAALEKLRAEEEHRKIAEQKRVTDSLQQIKLVAEQRRIADSLKLESFRNNLLTQAEELYGKWQKDSLKTADIKEEVLLHYVSEVNSDKMHDTRIENELYSGGWKKRKKQGTGILKVDRLKQLSSDRRITESLMYYGEFDADTFQSGKVFTQEYKKTYIGEYANGVEDGLGFKKLPNGNYLLGTFGNGSFIGGISNWASDGKHYFGSYIHERQTGFGEKYIGNNLYVGKFDDGKPVDGYAKEVDDFGNISYSKFEGTVKTEATKAEVEQFLDALQVSKKKLSLSDKSSTTSVEDIVATDSSTLTTPTPKRKYKVPHYFGVSVGAAVPVLGFNQDPAYALVAPKASLDAWFRMANAIGFKLKIGCSSYSVSENYKTDVEAKPIVNSTGRVVNVRNRYDMLWFVHFYDAGFGLNLGGKVGSLELAALTGLAVVHQPLYFYQTDNLYWDKGRPTWNFQGEAAIRINCSKTFAFRFGATYFLSQATDFNGYSYDNYGFVSDKYQNKPTAKVWIHSIDPFLSFLGLF